MRYLETFLARMAALLLFLMMLIVVIDVVGRGLFNAPLSIGTELTELVMMAMVFMVLPLLAYRQRDITVDIVNVVSRPWLRKLQVLLSGLCGALVFAATVWQFKIFGDRARESGEVLAQMGLPLAYVWYFMAVMGVVTALAFLAIVVALLIGRPIASGKPEEVF
ncbi:TRAP transporter small permease [Hydrogenophaga sp.]|uniref:TRAP transporter small permease n=1 Tax=Hydrogenophaga sp. TaxID=1904254 RepID=UPI00262429A5|nr:TRAP transporter small permease [Hydrogenophaga sp.]MCW5653892.1 TRAP transporter small permease [Hydrogenophaga sp.]